MDKTKRSPAKAREKTHFWNWDSDEDTGVRTLYLDGTIADESWWDDEITPRMFKDELMSGDSDIVVWINSPGVDCVAASQIYAMLMDYPHEVTVKIGAHGTYGAYDDSQSTHGSNRRHRGNAKSHCHAGRS